MDTDTSHTPLTPLTPDDNPATLSPSSLNTSQEEPLTSADATTDTSSGSEPSESTSTTSSGVGEDGTFNDAYTSTVSSIDQLADFLKAKAWENDVTSGGQPEPEAPTKEQVYTNDGFLPSSPLPATHDKPAPLAGDLLPDSRVKDEGTTEVEDGSSKEEKTPTDESQGQVEDFVQHHLIPIIENEVTSFKVEEVEPSQYPRITANITTADESFLHASQGSLWEEPNPGRRASTMHNLHERASFLNLTSDGRMGRAFRKALVHLKDDVNFGSLAGLNSAGFKDTESNTLLDGAKPLYIVASGRHVKNLLAVCFTIVLNFIALGSCRNLQSSINHEGGVGVISMAVSFTGYMLGSIVSPSLVQNCGARSCLIAALIPHFVYVAANIYPAMWLMVPVSLCQGIALAIAWNAMSTYITLLSKGHALKMHEDYAAVNGRFFGIFGLISQSYFIVGNLIASLVLSYASYPVSDDVTALGNSSTSAVNTSAGPHYKLATNGHAALTSHAGSSSKYNLSTIGHTAASVVGGAVADSLNTSLSEGSDSYLHLCGANFWQHFDLGGDVYNVSNETKFLLFGIYMGSVALAMLVAICFLENLNPRLFESSEPALERFKNQLVSLLKFITDRRFLMILPMLMYSFMEVGFVTSEMTKAFVTCPLGMHMVGYTMMFLGICGSLSSYISGLLTKCTGRIPLILWAAGMNLGVLVAMDVWAPTTDSLVPFFAIMGLWGASDGIWVSQSNSLMSVVFPDKFEEAFAGLRMAQGIGVATVFGSSPAMSMRSKIYMLGGLCIFGIIMYLIMEILLRREKKKRPITIRQTSV